MAVGHADERHVGPFWEARMALNLRTQRLPILGKTVDEYRALWIADIQDGYFPQSGREGDVAADLASVEARRAHVHFEEDSPASATEQPKLFGAGAGLDGHLIRSTLGVNNE